MKKIMLAFLPLALVLVPAQALARAYTFPGSVCQPVASSAGCVDYSVYGVNNICAASIVVECPLSISTLNISNTTVSLARYFAYDRNTTLNLSCTLERSFFSGEPVFSAVASTVGGGAGSDVQTITFTSAVGQGATGYWHARCSIPGSQSGAFSYLSSIYIATTE
jgi:hypothetical protein